MKIYQQLVKELDAGGEHNSRTLSEVDVTDPDDVKITVDDPDGAVLVHLGSTNFAGRFKRLPGEIERVAANSTSTWKRWTCVTTGR